MPSVNLGRVSPVPKGQWSSSTTYEKLDVVTNGGSSYIANQNVPIGTSLSTTEYWTKLVGGLTIGTVETVPYGSGASANIVTTSTNDQILNLEIPQGINGNETIDDSKGENDTDYVWSADKNYKENEKIKSMLSGIETSMTTTTNYNKGDLVVVNSKLYRFTTNTSSGATITVGSNVVETTIEAELALKANSANLGTLASKNNAPSDNKIYGMKNEEWEEIANIEWGNVTGNISNQADLQNSLDDKLDSGVGEILTGDIVSFSANNEKAIKNLKIAIEPQQDLHGYDNPWPAGGGKNLYNKDADYKSLGKMWNSGSGNLMDSTDYYGSPKIPISPSTQYVRNAGANANIFFDANGDYLSSSQTGTAITTPENAYYISFNIAVSVDNGTVQVEKGTTSTPYAPYSNVCPISGWTQSVVTRTGKNLYDKTSYPLTMGYIHRGGGNKVNSEDFYCTDYIPFVLPEGTIINLNHTPSGTWPGMAFYNSNKTYISGGKGNAITIPFGCAYLRFTVDNTYSNGNDVQIEFGSTATAYTPFAESTSITIDLDGTRYGGTLDVTMGVLTVTHSVIDMGDMSWQSTSSGWRSNTLISTIKPPSANNVVADIKCSAYASGSANSASANDGVIGVITDGYVRAHNSNYETATDFKASVVGVQLVYPLLETQTIQLTPVQLTTLINDNILWSDTGKSTVTLRIPVGDLAYINDAPSNGNKYTRKDNDWYNISEDINTKADSIKRTTSGSIASFNDGADEMPVAGLTVAVEPVQSFNGYDHPWPGGGNINECPGLVKVKVDGNGFHADENGTHWGCVEHMPVTAEAPIYFGMVDNTSGSNSNIVVRYYQADDTFISQATVNSFPSTVPTTPADAAYCMVRTSSDIATVGNDVKILVSMTNPNGQYSPYENVCPISGWTEATVKRTGKNLLSGLIEGRFSVDSNFVVDASDLKYRSFKMMMKPGTYTISFGIAVNIIRLGLGAPVTSISQTNVSSYTFTVPKEEYIGMSWRRNDNTSWDNTTWVQIESGSTATTYEPYQGTTLPISWQSEAGTVYGGWLNVTTGVLTVDRVLHTLTGTESAIGLSAEGSGNPRRFLFNWSLTQGWEQYGTGTQMSNIFRYVGSSNVTQTFGIFRMVGIYIVFPDADSQFADATAFKEWLASMVTAGTPVQISYPLATPLTYQLSPHEVQTILGDNNIWSDTGNVNVTYQADTKKYIDNAIAESMRSTRKMIAGEEKEMKATQNYTIGEYLWVGDDLYKVTANISNSSNITIGTNVQKCTIGEQLKLALS